MVPAAADQAQPAAAADLQRQGRRCRRPSSGIIQTWNEGATRLFGYTAEEGIGKPVTILIPPDRVDEEPGILERVRRGETVDHYETVRRRKDGSLVDISLTV